MQAFKLNRETSGCRMKNQFNDIALSQFNALYGFALSITAVSADAGLLLKSPISGPNCII